LIYVSDALTAYIIKAIIGATSQKTAIFMNDALTVLFCKLDEGIWGGGRRSLKWRQIQTDMASFILDSGTTQR
jgi:hypothetical protein